MTVPQKLKALIECHEWFETNESYAEILRSSLIQDLPGYPKVEIDGDTSEEIRFVTSENYNEEKYELLDIKNFEIVSVDDEEIILCAGGDWQAPLTFSIKENEKNGKLQIGDIYQGFNEGMSDEEFDDLMLTL